MRLIREKSFNLLGNPKIVLDPWKVIWCDESRFALVLCDGIPGAKREADAVMPSADCTSLWGNK